MAEQVKYLDYAGLQVLVTKIKAGDAAALKAAKDYVGAIPADATQTTVIEYLMAEIAKAQEAATFDGKASSVSIEDANGYYNAENVEGALAEVKVIADANATAVATLTNDAETTGSVLNAIKVAKDYTDSEIGTLTIGETSYSTVKDYVDAKATAEATARGEDKTELEGKIAAAKDAADAAQGEVDDLEALVGTLPTEQETVVGYIKSVEDKVTGDAGQIADDLAAEIERATKAEGDLQDAIDAHKTAIDGVVTTLVGDDANKSVRTIANEELAAQLIPESAKESLDTLEEIAAWIQNHPDDASAMNKAIGDLQTLVGTIPESATATDIVGLINELVGAETTRATGVEGGLDSRIADLEEAMGEGGGVSQQIQAAVEALDSDASQEAGADGLALSVVLADGKVTSISGSIAANTYDAYGAASDVQGETEKTVKDIEDALSAFENSIDSITEDEINGLFTE